MATKRVFTMSKLSAAEFDSFSAGHPQGNFQQSSRMGDLRTKEGIAIEYIGVREAGEIVAATQLELHQTKLSTYTNIHNGPLCNFNDHELTAFFFDALKKRSRELGAAQIEFTPEMPYAVRTSDGDLVEDDADHAALNLPENSPAGTNSDAYQELMSLGCEHGGFYLGYSAVPRWRYVKDLSRIKDENALTASYAKNTKRNVRIARTSGVHVEPASRDDLPVFRAICEMSGEKQGFENPSLEYFQMMYDALGDDCEFKIAYIEAKAYLEEWETKRDGFAADVKHLSESLETARSPEKIEKKLADVQKKHDAALKRIEQAHAYIAEDGEKIPAAAALFIWHKRECVYLFSGSNQKYAKFYAATAIQHQMMLECLERGCDRYNFYGINGVFNDPKDPGRGLLEFKQGFGGYVEELMGSFTLPVKPVVYKAKRLARKVLGR